MFIPYKLCCTVDKTFSPYAERQSEREKGKKVEITPAHKTLSSWSEGKFGSFHSFYDRSGGKNAVAILHRKNVFWQSAKDEFDVCSPVAACKHTINCFDATAVLLDASCLIFVSQFRSFRSKQFHAQSLPRRFHLMVTH